jgi:predicted nucleotidyltransferase
MILQTEQSEEIVRRLTAELSPEEIYLFGSQAAGTAVEGRSDVDLCVIVPDDDESSYSKSVRAYQSLRGLGLPKDIIVRHRSRFTERARWTSSVEHEVVLHGRRIYRRA